MEAAHSALSRSKKEIEDQNTELKLQKEEIMSINETLEEQKVNISLQHDAITKSINYAQSIQEAVLPSKHV